MRQLSKSHPVWYKWSLKWLLVPQREERFLQHLPKGSAQSDYWLQEAQTRLTYTPHSQYLYVPQMGN